MLSKRIEAKPGKRLRWTSFMIDEKMQTGMIGD